MNFTLKKSDLNFKVYTVASKPTTPGAENDIAIISSVPMTNWIMSPEAPSGAPRNDGDVWILYSTSGNTFNALKHTAMMIATTKAWQYVDGAWVDREAVSCQGGVWYDNGFYIFKSGQGEKVALTTYKEDSSNIVTIGMDAIVLSYSDEPVCCGIQTESKYDLTPYNSIKVEYTCSAVSSGGDADWASAFGVSTSKLTAGTTAEVIDVKRKQFVNSTSLKTVTLDISKLSGSYYLGAYGSSKVTIRNFWLK